MKTDDIEKNSPKPHISRKKNKLASAAKILLLGRKTMPKQLKDPLLIQKVGLNEDVYALTWNVFRKDHWEDVKVHDIPISLSSCDHFKIILHFLVFVMVVIATVGILVYESFISDTYNDAEWPIIILRLSLVAFAQKKIEPEVFQALVLYRYSRRNEEQFMHPTFCKFVALVQLFMSILTFIAIFLFVCMSNEALNLIMNFAGLSVISELDDWVGEQIMSETIHTEFEEDGPYVNAKLNTENLNDRMGFYTKMYLVGQDMEITDDANKTVEVSCLTILANYIPWILLPLLTLPCEYLLLKIQGYTKQISLAN
jgi:hypothetical protein